MPHHIYPIHNGRWIEIENPSRTDLEFLRKEFPFFHITNLEDSMQRVSKSKLDIMPDYMFFAETVPVHISKGSKAENFEASFFLTKDSLVTITHQKTELFKSEIKEEDKMAEVKLSDNPSVLFYRFLEKIYDNMYPVIDMVGRQVNEVDESILQVSSPKFIREIALLQRNIIFFITTIRDSITYFEELESKNIKYGELTMNDYWGDLNDKLKLQRRVLEDYDYLLSKLAQAHENYLNYQTNHIINVLTVFSVIMLPLNLIAGIFGMNFVDGMHLSNPLGFYLTLFSMIIILVVMFIYFKHKRWF